MRQARSIELETSVGYLLKVTSIRLRQAMEEVLRPLGMNVTHYACLELLAQRPGLSNSGLARGAFVTRQSMNALLQSLERDGIIERVEEERSGRAVPLRLTGAGRVRLEAASAAVRQVELRMVERLSDDEVDLALRLLRTMSSSLEGPAQRS